MGKSASIPPSSPSSFVVLTDGVCWVTDFAEFVSPALVDVAKPGVVAPSRFVAFSPPHHMRRIQRPGLPRTEKGLNEQCRYREIQRLPYARDCCRLRDTCATARSL